MDCTYFMDSIFYDGYISSIGIGKCLVCALARHFPPKKRKRGIMAYVNQIDWNCGCMRMTEFNYISGKERTVGRSYCRKQDCDRKGK